LAEPTKDELLARIAELEQQFGKRRPGALEFSVGDVSILVVRLDDGHRLVTTPTKQTTL
jgi:hypothetical protein